MRRIKNANGPSVQMFLRSARQWPNWQRSIRGTGSHYLNLMASMKNMVLYRLKTIDFLRQTSRTGLRDVPESEHVLQKKSRNCPSRSPLSKRSICRTDPVVVTKSQDDVTIPMNLQRVSSRSSTDKKRPHAEISKSVSVKT